LNYINHVDDAQISVDAAKLQQVMSNLLSNAIKFSPVGAEVCVGTGWHDGNIRITVSDQGPGISPDFHGRIFQKFAQADSSDSRKQGGTGLGLAITRELVENMHGTVSFESEQGQGARFFVDLPARSMSDASVGR
jgi:signal transduction histidine kinase